MIEHIDPTKRAFSVFCENNREGPIHMLNLVRLREQARYPDGRQATGAEAYAAYGRESRPISTRLVGRIVWQGKFELTLIGNGRCQTLKELRHSDGIRFSVIRSREIQ